MRTDRFLKAKLLRLTISSAIFTECCIVGVKGGSKVPFFRFCR